MVHAFLVWKFLGLSFKIFLFLVLFSVPVIQVGGCLFADDIYLALSPRDTDLLDSHIRDKRIACNLTADKHESMKVS